MLRLNQHQNIVSPDSCTQKQLVPLETSSKPKEYEHQHNPDNSRETMEVTKHTWIVKQQCNYMGKVESVRMPCNTNTAKQWNAGKHVALNRDQCGSLSTQKVTDMTVLQGLISSESFSECWSGPGALVREHFAVLGTLTMRGGCTLLPQAY